MTVPDPPWKQKTRPCPFYSQGRCLFADSCNFLHSVNVKRPEGIIIPAQRPARSTSTSPVLKMVRFRSPPRSPRTSSLLLALGDIIQQDEEVEAEVFEDEGGEDDGRGSVEDLTFEEEESTLVNSTLARDSPLVHSTDEDKFGSHRDSSLTTGSSSSGDDGEVTITRFSKSLIPAASTRTSTSSDAPTEGLLSPIDITEAIPVSLPLNHCVQREDSIDSGYADTWTGPSSFLASPPRASRPVSTLSLLSSPFTSPASRVFSPHSAFPDTHASYHSDVDDEPSPHEDEASLHPYEPSLPDDKSRSPSPVQAVVRPDTPSEDDLQDEGFDEFISFESFIVPSPPQDSIVLDADVPEQSSDLTVLPAPPPTVFSRPASSAVMGSVSQSQENDGLEVLDLSNDTVNSLYDGYYSTASPDGDDVDDTVVQQLQYEGTDDLFEEVQDTKDDSLTEEQISLPVEDQVLSSVVQEREMSPSMPERSSTHVQEAISTSSPQPASPNTHDVLPSASSSSDRNSSSDNGRTSYVDSGETLSAARILSPPHSLSQVVVAEEQTASPVTLNSPFEERLPRVFSVADATRTLPRAESPSHRRSPPSQRESRDITLEKRASTTKVPFGFRHSVSDRSVLSKRASTSTASSRHRPPALVGLSPTSQGRALSRDSRNLSLDEPTSSASNGSLKPLRLSMILNSSPLGSASISSSIPPPLSTGTSAFTPSSPTVSSDYSVSHNQLLSSRRSSLIPARTHNTLVNTHEDAPLFIAPDSPSSSGPHSAPISHRSSWQSRHHIFRNSSYRQSRTEKSIRSDSRFFEKYIRPDSRLSEPGILYEDDEEEDNPVDSLVLGDPDETIRRPLSSLSRPQSAFASPLSRPISTPRPTLMFALASDNIDEVRRVLESGEANPNDEVGPQSALAFTLGARQLSHRVEMTKLLLAYGADPSALGDASQLGASASHGGAAASPSVSAKLMKDMDPATRYYVARAKAPQTRRASSLIYRTGFRPLARVRYDLIGQDRALEQLFRVLSMPTMAPIVVLLCGPSGHGKSLLARKFGSLLEVPTHTVNMTTLRSTHDIWRSYSMSPYEAPSTCTLADFLISNEGKRCVVVLDVSTTYMRYPSFSTIISGPQEIEKTEDEKILASLLMPWELGRCSFEAGHRHVDVSQVIWLGTSNVGHDLVFEHQHSRRDPEANMSREEYVDLMGLLRPRVSKRLGASLLSRVTTVLPFVPFNTDEKMAIAAEALFSLAGEEGKTLPPATVEMIVRNSLSAYLPAEGARSLYRAVSTQLLDTI
ncbi:hypothetical protein B0H21DRAFT_3681 [Amylocystis lapponica]|nr:hypothetical protein B0H21DRAFT_3681 [Amylocystis lapponica]